MERARQNSVATRVDPERVRPGQVITFRYSKGIRAGEKRTVIVQRIVPETTEDGIDDYAIKCLERNSKGELVKRSYYVGKTSGVSYEAGDALRMADINDLSLAHSDRLVTPAGRNKSTDRPMRKKTDQDRESAVFFCPRLI